jgi:hypothetical protein
LNEELRELKLKSRGSSKKLVELDNTLCEFQGKMDELDIEKHTLTDELVLEKDGRGVPLTDRRIFVSGIVIALPI